MFVLLWTFFCEWLINTVWLNRQKTWWREQQKISKFHLSVGTKTYFFMLFVTWFRVLSSLLYVKGLFDSEHIYKVMIFATMPEFFIWSHHRNDLEVFQLFLPYLLVFSHIRRRNSSPKKRMFPSKLKYTSFLVAALRRKTGRLWKWILSGYDHWILQFMLKFVLFYNLTIWQRQATKP